jgi:uncharacterized protein
MYITASKLYDYIKCPHKVWRDAHGPQDEKIKEDNPFVQLLWEKGVLHEKTVIERIGKFVDLSSGPLEDRFNKTLEEMKKGTPLIYQGVLQFKNLLGIPDLLKRVDNGQYIPVDIKSGKGTEGADEFEDGKFKKHYALQLCLYVDALIKLGYATQRTALIIDIAGDEVEYDLDAPQGVRNTVTWWQEYEAVKNIVEKLLQNSVQNHPAFSGICKLCGWYNSCKKWCIDEEDLSTIFYLGRSNRDIIQKDLNIRRVNELCSINITNILTQKKADKQFLKGFGEKLLTKFINRARILSQTKRPVAYNEINFPDVEIELFFDIEDDPTQNFVYLHGVYERKADKTRFIYFVAKENTLLEEKKAWADFWAYIRLLPEGGYSVYYYSHHEKSTYKRLRERFPDVISEEELESFFSNPNVIDLYQIVTKYTDWPLSSYSLKELATYLKFKWRDETPSGALSIQWFNEYLKSKSDKILNRILEYNEDDCKATMILKDGITGLKIYKEAS